jgi:hypothetical protein
VSAVHAYSYVIASAAATAAAGTAASTASSAAATPSSQDDTVPTTPPASASPVLPKPCAGPRLVAQLKKLTTLDATAATAAEGLSAMGQNAPNAVTPYPISVISFWASLAALQACWLGVALLQT